MDAVNDGKLVIFDIDVQGHDIVQEKLAHLTTSVFITTPTLSELQHRLDNRNTDTQEVINKRIQNAKLEINALDRYDYFIINDDLKTASSNLISVAKATMLKSKLFSKKELINNWLN